MDENKTLYDILTCPFDENLHKCIWYKAESENAPALSGFTFVPLKNIAGWNAYENSWLKVAEVIGNLYENPDLLQKNSPSLQAAA